MLGVGAVDWQCADFVILIEVGVNCLQILWYLGHLLTDLAEIWWTFDRYLGQKPIKVLAKSIHTWPRKCVFIAILKAIHANLN